MFIYEKIHFITTKVESLYLTFHLYLHEVSASCTHVSHIREKSGRGWWISLWANVCLYHYNKVIPQAAETEHLIFSSHSLSETCSCCSRPESVSAARESRSQTTSSRALSAATLLWRWCNYYGYRLCWLMALTVSKPSLKNSSCKVWKALKERHFKHVFLYGSVIHRNRSWLLGHGNINDLSF